jgi:hypothetical protein
VEVDGREGSWPPKGLAVHTNLPIDGAMAAVAAFV